MQRLQLPVSADADEMTDGPQVVKIGKSITNPLTLNPGALKGIILMHP